MASYDSDYHVDVNNPRITSRRLDRHLNPKGDTVDGNQVTPSVRDDSDNIVQYHGGNRLTEEIAVVDIGDSPNSQTGDPLRTAFIKINNIIEAMYWTNDAIDKELERIDTRGSFIGFTSYENLPDDITDITTGNVAIINETLEIPNDSDDVFRETFNKIRFETIPAYTGKPRVQEGSLLQWDGEMWCVVFENKAINQAFDFGESLAKYADGEADSALTPDEQIALYNEFNDTKAAQNRSVDVKARNVNDAITELHMRFSQRGLDAGYYG